MRLLLLPRVAALRPRFSRVLALAYATGDWGQSPFEDPGRCRDSIRASIGAFSCRDAPRVPTGPSDPNTLLPRALPTSHAPAAPSRRISPRARPPFCPKGLTSSSLVRYHARSWRSELSRGIFRCGMLGTSSLRTIGVCVPHDCVPYSFHSPLPLFAPLYVSRPMPMHFSFSLISLSLPPIPRPLLPGLAECAALSTLHISPIVSGASFAMFRRHKVVGSGPPSIGLSLPLLHLSLFSSVCAMSSCTSFICTPTHLYTTGTCI